MQWDPRTNELAFELARKDGTEPVPVAYHGILPDMFAEGREVVVEGRYGQGALAAKQIMTSCPSKYEPQKTEHGHEAQPPEREPMPELGRLAICLALLCALFSIGASIRGALRAARDIVRSGEHAAYAVFGLVVAGRRHPAARAADARLLASSTSPRTRRARCRLHYTVAALWGGQKGSLLFWTLHAHALHRRSSQLQNRERNRELMPYVTATLMTIAVFFLVAADVHHAVRSSACRCRRSRAPT